MEFETAKIGKAKIDKFKFTTIITDNTTYLIVNTVTKALNLNLSAQQFKLKQSSEEYGYITPKLNIGEYKQDIALIPMNNFKKWMISIIPEKLKPSPYHDFANFQNKIMKNKLTIIDLGEV
jgi:hypothetical protein